MGEFKARIRVLSKHLRSSAGFQMFYYEVHPGIGPVEKVYFNLGSRNICQGNDFFRSQGCNVTIYGNNRVFCQKKCSNCRPFCIQGRFGAALAYKVVKAFASSLGNKPLNTCNSHLYPGCNLFTGEQGFVPRVVWGYIGHIFRLPSTFI